MKQRSSKSFSRFCAVLLAVACSTTVVALPAAAQDVKRLEGSVTTAPLQNAPAAISNARKPLGSGVRLPAGAAMVALTAAECTTLGGSTVTETVCNSGKACQTTTEDGSWKRVCLSKAE